MSSQGLFKILPPPGPMVYWCCSNRVCGSMGTVMLQQQSAHGDAAATVVRVRAPCCSNRVHMGDAGHHVDTGIMLQQQSAHGDAAATVVRVRAPCCSNRAHMGMLQQQW